MNRPMWTATIRAHRMRDGLRFAGNLTDAEWAVVRPSHGWFAAWRDAGVWQAANHRLVMLDRERVGCEATVRWRSTCCVERKLYRKAKAQPAFRFLILCDKICREDILLRACPRQCGCAR